MEAVNYFHLQYLMSDILDKTGIDFTEDRETMKKFRAMTKEEARKLKFIINVRPHILKDYVYKNIINKPF